MFVIVSKKKAAAAVPAAPPAADSAASTSSRTQNACDSCRVRKSKCDGLTPCGRCVAKRLVCTSSRRVAKAVGPVTEEHVAILQQQQQRLTRAISNMADLIRRLDVESRGPSASPSAGEPHVAASELSPMELEQVLQRFAPESKTTTRTSPLADGLDVPLPSSKKKRRFHETATEDALMDDAALAQTDNDGYGQFQKFLATVQQQQQQGSSRLNPTAHSFQPAFTDFEALSSQPRLQSQHTADPVGTSDAYPAGTSTELDRQLAPFMDMIDWDASLDFFLDGQSNGGDFEWDFTQVDGGLPNNAAWEHEMQD